MALRSEFMYAMKRIRLKILYYVHYCVLCTCYNSGIMYNVSGMSPRSAAPGTRILSGRWRQKCQAVDDADPNFFLLILSLYSVWQLLQPAGILYEISLLFTTSITDNVKLDDASPVFVIHLL